MFRIHEDTQAVLEINPVIHEAHQNSDQNMHYLL